MEKRYEVVEEYWDLMGERYCAVIDEDRVLWGVHEVKGGYVVNQDFGVSLK